MSVLSIHRVPDPILNQPTRLVLPDDSSVAKLIDQMTATLRHHPRCVGLAAPQVGRSLRVAVMDASVHPKAKKNHGFLVLINPSLIDREGGAVQREGCLSIPDFTGNVRRSTRVRLRAQDRNGFWYERLLEGFEAIVAQHEVDHLDGMLFLDRVTNLKTDVFRRKTYL